MHQSKKKHLVTFDLGGVVVQVARSIDDAANRAGLCLSDPSSSVEHSKLSALHDMWQVGTIADEDFFEEWAGAHGNRFSPRDAAAISASYLIGQYEGLEEITDQLLSQGIALGCLSNTCNHHWKVMHGDSKRFPSVKSFEYPHASHLWGVMKPQDRIYELYEEATGYGAEQIVFFDDLAENVEAATRRGWKAYRILPDREPSMQIREALRGLAIGDF